MVKRKNKKKKNYKIYSKDNREYMMESFLRDEINGDGFDEFLDLSFEIYGVESTFNLYGMAIRKMKEVMDNEQKEKEQ